MDLETCITLNKGESCLIMISSILLNLNSNESEASCDLTAHQCQISLLRCKRNLKSRSDFRMVGTIPVSRISASNGKSALKQIFQLLSWISFKHL